nr:KUP/HAK/KT family potassium transporter [Paraburkholderia metrosideri]
MAGLALGAIGIVFGDIGTSPLYTMSTVFDSGLRHAGHHDDGAQRTDTD